MKRPLLAALIVLTLVVPRFALAAEVLVFAASSLKEALEDVSAEWEAGTGHRAILSFAGSSTLARQIEAGAPADLFLSANEAWLDRLEAGGLLRPGSRRDLLTNRLVLVAHDPAAPAIDPADPQALAKALGEGWLAMALVDAVPAGIYGRAALQSLGWWEGVAQRVAQADNVRAALALVATGEAPYGIVYATDALAEPRVTAVLTFPQGSHPPIRYPMAIPAGGASAEADAFAAYLTGVRAGEIFRAHGFGLADGALN